jgi:hypothetical protein
LLEQAWVDFMKRKISRLPVLGVGILSPALLGQPIAVAHPVDPAEPIQQAVVGSSVDIAKALLTEELFSLSPSEKLKIGGGRIPAMATDALKRATARMRTHLAVITDYCTPTSACPSSACPSDGCPDGSAKKGTHGVVKTPQVKSKKPNSN